jgi:hypothetical protein
MLFPYRRYLWHRRTQMLGWRLRRESIREGFIGGNRVWQVVGVAVHGRRVFRKVMNSGPELAARERIRPGETIILRGIDQRTEPDG